MTAAHSSIVKCHEAEIISKRYKKATAGKSVKLQALHVKSVQFNSLFKLPLYLQEEEEEEEYLQLQLEACM